MEDKQGRELVRYSFRIGKDQLEGLKNVSPYADVSKIIRYVIDQYLEQLKKESDKQ